jgi:hypothetical protein
VSKIFEEEGFRENTGKRQVGKLAGNVAITCLRVRRRKLDVCPSFCERLERDIADAASLAADGHFVGPFYLREQLRGRVEFVRWVRPSRAKVLQTQLRQVDWSVHRMNGEKRGLVVAKKQLHADPESAMRALETMRVRTEIPARITTA